MLLSANKIIAESPESNQHRHTEASQGRRLKRQKWKIRWSEGVIRETTDTKFFFFFLPVSGVNQLWTQTELFESFITNHHDYCCGRWWYDASREAFGHPPESFFSDQLVKGLNDWCPAFHLPPEKKSDIWLLGFLGCKKTIRQKWENWGKHTSEK